MRQKTSVILVAILVALVVLIIVGKQRSPMQKRTPLFDFSHDRIAMISLSLGADSLYIKKDFQSARWYSVYPQKIAVSEEKINNFFTKVVGVEKFARALTTDPQRFHRHLVTKDNGTQLTFYDVDSVVLADFFIGVADIISYGAAREVGGRVVYELAENIMLDVNPTLANWRVHQFLSFELASTDSIVVQSMRSSYTLLHEESSWRYRDADTTFGLTATHTAFTRMINQLENMRTRSFIDYSWDEYASSFEDPILVLSIYSHGGVVDVLRVARHGESEYILMKNDDRDTLYRVTNDMVGRFLKTTEEVSARAHIF
jgi:hypothetical protein